MKECAKLLIDRYGTDIFTKFVFAEAGWWNGQGFCQINLREVVHYTKVCDAIHFRAEFSEIADIVACHEPLFVLQLPKGSNVKLLIFGIPS